MKRNLILFGMLLLITQAAFTAEIQTITLKDQTSIRGEVVGMQNGVYSVKTQAMGTLAIPANQVVSIVSDGAIPVPQAPAIREGLPRKAGMTAVPRKAIGTGSARLQRPRNRPATAAEGQDSSEGQKDFSEAQKDAAGRVQSMMMNKDFSENVSTLADNPTMEDVLNDPETMRQIQSGDYSNLMNNEKMKKLMDSSEIQNLLGNFESEKGE